MKIKCAEGSLMKTQIYSGCKTAQVVVFVILNSDTIITYF